jgi:hypothetical protein
MRDLARLPSSAARRTYAWTAEAGLFERDRPRRISPSPGRFRAISAARRSAHFTPYLNPANCDYRSPSLDWPPNHNRRERRKNTRLALRLRMADKCASAQKVMLRNAPALILAGLAVKVVGRFVPRSARCILIAPAATVAFFAREKSLRRHRASRPARRRRTACDIFCVAAEF